MTKPLARSGSDVLGAVTVPKSFIHGWEIAGVPQYASVGLAFNGTFLCVAQCMNLRQDRRRGLKLKSSCSEAPQANRTTCACFSSLPSTMCFLDLHKLQFKLVSFSFSLPVFQTYQIWLDRWTPHTASRWVFTAVLIAAFMLRIVLKQVRITQHLCQIARRPTRSCWTTPRPTSRPAGRSASSPWPPSSPGY